MFAPRGYYTWNEVARATNDWAETIVRAHHLGVPKSRLADYIEGEDEYAYLWMEHLKANPTEVAIHPHEVHLLSAYLMANFMLSTPVSMCSPTGTVLRAPEVALVHADRFDYCVWDWERHESSQFRIFYQSATDGSLKAANPWDRFCFAEQFSGSINLKNNSIKTVLRASHSWDLNEADVKRVITHFLGWALCWHADDIPKKTEMIFNAMGGEFIDFAKAWDQLDQGPRNVRESAKVGSSLDFVYQCLIEVFPDGKGHATWAEIESKTGYSRRQINRALKQQNASWWASGGGQG